MRLAAKYGLSDVKEGLPTVSDAVYGHGLYGVQS